MATPALAINIANHKHITGITCLGNCGFFCFGACCIACFRTFRFTCYWFFRFFCIRLVFAGGYGRRRFTLPGRFICCISSVISSSVLLSPELPSSALLSSVLHSPVLLSSFMLSSALLSSVTLSSVLFSPGVLSCSDIWVFSAMISLSSAATVVILSCKCCCRHHRQQQAACEQNRQALDLSLLSFFIFHNQPPFFLSFIAILFCLL